MLLVFCFSRPESSWRPCSREMVSGGHFLALIRTLPYCWCPSYQGSVLIAQAVSLSSWLLSALKSCSNISALFNHPQIAQYRIFLLTPMSQLCNCPVNSLKPGPMVLSSRCGPTASTCLEHSRHSMSVWGRGGLGERLEACMAQWHYFSTQMCVYVSVC